MAKDEIKAFEHYRLAAEAGFPEGAINVVPGLGEEAGAALADSTTVIESAMSRAVIRLPCCLSASAAASATSPSTSSPSTGVRKRTSTSQRASAGTVLRVVPPSKREGRPAALRLRLTCSSSCSPSA